ncbi:hypothetical protein C3L33_14948, partial [Rhododendron williamsianum]
MALFVIEVVPDRGDVNIANYFEECFNFIDGAKRTVVVYWFTVLSGNPEGDCSYTIYIVFLDLMYSEGKYLKSSVPIVSVEPPDCTVDGSGHELDLFPFVIVFPCLFACFGFLNNANGNFSCSVTIVVAYLMKKYSMSMSEALKHVKSKRPIASPNSGFMTQLQNFEKSLQGTHRRAQEV